MSDEVLTVTQADRCDLTHHEQMVDAQLQCAPCSLCGGKAIIADAGGGAGYYIACENGSAFRAEDRCLITDRRLGGWAYNVTDWWNRLHRQSQPEPLAGEGEIERVARMLWDAVHPTGTSWDDWERYSRENKGKFDGRDAFREIARTILASLQAGEFLPKPKGEG